MLLLHSPGWIPISEGRIKAPGPCNKSPPQSPAPQALPFAGSPPGSLSFLICKMDPRIPREGQRGEDVRQPAPVRAVPTC